MGLLEVIDQYVLQFDIEKFRYQTFVILICFVVMPLLLSIIKRIKRNRELRKQYESAPIVFGRQLMELITNIVRDTIEQKNIIGRPIDLSCSSDRDLFVELHVDYLFMVSVSLKGLIGKPHLENQILKFTEQYCYPRLLQSLDLEIEDLERYKKLFEKRFAEYNEVPFVKQDQKTGVLDLAHNMVHHFCLSQEQKDHQDAVSDIITEICHVLNEVPILFYKFKYKL